MLNYKLLIKPLLSYSGKNLSIICIEEERRSKNVSFGSRVIKNSTKLNALSKNGFASLDLSEIKI